MGPEMGDEDSHEAVTKGGVAGRPDRDTGCEAGLAARGLHLLGPGHRVELDSAVAAGGDQGVRVGEAPVHAVHPGHVDTHTTQRPRAARAGLVTSTPGVPELDIS